MNVTSDVAAASPKAAPSAPATSAASSIPLKDKIGEILANNWQLLAVTLLVGISVALVVGMFFYYVVKNGQIGKKNVYPVKGMETPVVATQVTKFGGAQMPSNPEELSMSFWIYVESFDRMGDAYRHVLHRGDQATVPGKVGPHVYFDKSSNKLHIAFRPKDQSNPFDTPVDFLVAAGNEAVIAVSKPIIPIGKTASDRIKQFEYVRGKGGITIDYIPAQRWVHVMVTVNRKNNIIKAYVDGEEVKTAGSSTRGSIKVEAVGGKDTVPWRMDLTKTDILGSGDFYVGGKASSTTGIGFAGLVSNLKFFDYTLDKAEVYKEYRRGPIDNLMSKMGLPAYGVRAPIYPLTAKSS